MALRGPYGALKDMSAHAITIREFCDRYSVGRSTVYQEIAEGRLVACKVGRRTLITESAIQTWLDNLPTLKPSVVAD